MFCIVLDAERLKHAQAIQNGSSRYWELGNPKNQYVCIGGMGPVQFDKNYPKVSQLIDFENKVSHEKLKAM